MTFSGFMYEHVCFDLVLEPWLERAPRQTEFDRSFRDRARHLRALLEECERAALRDHNSRITEMVNQVRGYFDLWDEAIDRRLTDDVSDK